MPKKRIDDLLIERGFARDKKHALAMLLAGEVMVNRRRITTAGTRIDTAAPIETKTKRPYVSRGGIKLAAALDAFSVDPTDAICADVGASTGGFTDVLLQRGAKKVYAIDVGYGDLAWKLRTDSRVVVMERTNARHVQSLPEPIALAVIDASFISLKRLLPAVKKWLQPSAAVVALIKPQFEAKRDDVGAGGVIRDAEIHQSVLTEILSWVETQSLAPVGLIASPITGPAGNKEFLVHLRTDAPSHPPLETLIAACV